MFKKIICILIVSVSCLMAQEKSWLVQKWLNNCNNRVHNGLNFAFGPLIYKRWNFSDANIAQDCKTTLREILESFLVKKELAYSVRYFLDTNVQITQEVKDALNKGLEERLKKSFAAISKEVQVVNRTDQGAIDISFLVYLSKFPVNDVEVWYGRVEGNLYFNDLYNIEYPVGVAYDGRVNLADGLNGDFEVIIQDHATAVKEVVSKDFEKKYLP